ncbi:hypothetical protein AX16_000878 [Volvariella volvacea WC 439]|nr:hypothetical protein AX16_000878 [Volvariella volvacea WC 439]
MKLSPGLSYLLRKLSSTLAIALVLPATHVIASNLGLVAVPPTPARMLLSLTLGVVLLPVARFIVLTPYSGIKHRWRAYRLGGRLAPQAKGKSLGNYDIVLALKEEFEHGYPSDSLTPLTDELGLMFNFRILWSDKMFTTSPEHIKMMLATKAQNFEKGDDTKRNMFPLLGTGIFNTDGEMWKFHRTMTRPAFSRDRISDFDIFDRHADITISKIKERNAQGIPVDIQDIMSRFTLDIATDFLFGSCVSALSDPLPYPHYHSLANDSSRRQSQADLFSQALLQIQNVCTHREVVGPAWPLFELWEDKTEEPLKIVKAYVEPFVRAALERKKSIPVEVRFNGKPEFEEGETLLDYLVKVTDGESLILGAKMQLIMLPEDPVIVKDEALNILFAGRDTTSSTLTYVLYFLARYPAVTARLRQEIIDKLGPDQNRKPTYDEIRGMKYLRAVINETLRLYPTVPFNLRESVEEILFPSPDPILPPIYVPPKTRITYCVFMMHRDKNLWGPDAEEFDPDRFLDERLQKYLLANSFIFLPFNAGPRICLGQQFAYNTISIMIIKLLQHFSPDIIHDLNAVPPGALPPEDWKQAGSNTRKGTETIFPKIHLLMSVNGGLWLKFKEAGGA